MVYDNQSRLVALTDPDKGNYLGKYEIHGALFDRYDRTWLIEYDDLGRKKRVIYPQTEPGIMAVKSYTYEDVTNSIEVKDPEGRIVRQRKDWNDNVLEVMHFGDNESLSDEYRHYCYKYDELNRKYRKMR